MKNVHVRDTAYIVVRVGFLVAAILALLRGDLEAMAIGFIGLGLSVVPQVLLRRFNLRLPLAYELSIIGFIFASIMLGEIFGAYSTFHWWDSMLHLSSGVIIGYIGFMILFTLHVQKKLDVSAGMMAFLTFSVAMMCAAVWEVIEFTIDQLFGSTMQHGNDDTMKDIVLAMVGSLFATGVAYWQHQWPDTSPIRGELLGFFRKNRHLLPKPHRDKKLSKGDIV